MIFDATPSISQLVTQTAHGCWIKKQDGRQLFDAASGAINVNVGYGNERVINAITSALKQISYLHPDENDEQRALLREKLELNWLPYSHTVIGFTCTGTESIELAVKAALHCNQCRGRPIGKRVLSLMVSYHGASFLAMGIGGKRKVHPNYNPYLGQALHLNNASTEDEIIWNLSNFLKIQETISAIVIEPIVGSSGGVLELSQRVWSIIKEFRSLTNIPIIFDETMTGFGRTGKEFSCMSIDVEPDFIVSGKGLAAGYAALTMVSARKDIADLLSVAKLGFMSTTMSGQPAAVAAALTVLDILEQDRLIDKAAQHGRDIATIASYLRQYPGIKDVRGRGLLWAIEADAKGDAKKQTILRNAMVAAANNAGINVYPAGIESNRSIVLFAPPLITPHEAIQSALETVVQVVSATVDHNARS